MTPSRGAGCRNAPPSWRHAPGTATRRKARYAKYNAASKPARHVQNQWGNPSRNAPPMAFYVTSRSQIDSSHARDAFAPRTVWLLGRPQIGRSMALIDPDGQSVITSRIQRILHGAVALYVQTRNSTYELEQAQFAEDS